MGRHLRSVWRQAINTFFRSFVIENVVDNGFSRGPVSEISKLWLLILHFSIDLRRVKFMLVLITPEIIIIPKVDIGLSEIVTSFTITFDYVSVSSSSIW